MSEWKPIETMPKLKEVLVYCDEAKFIGLAWKNKHGEIVMPEPQPIGYDTLTMWMPLPDLPK